MGRIGLDKETVSVEEVEGFVKNAGGVGIVVGSSLRVSKKIGGGLREMIGMRFPFSSTTSWSPLSFPNNIVSKLKAELTKMTI